MPNLSEEEKGEKSKAPPRFELGISCLLDRRFNQLSHGAICVSCSAVKQRGSGAVYTSSVTKGLHPTWGLSPPPYGRVSVWTYVAYMSRPTLENINKTKYRLVVELTIGVGSLWNS